MLKIQEDLMPNIKIKTFEVGSYAVNCYVVFDETTRECFIIDPGFESEVIKKYILSKDLRVKYVVNTHGHIDHIGCDFDFGVDVYIHESDADFLTDPKKNLSAFFTIELVFPNPVIKLAEGDVLSFPEHFIKVLHTPGHTPGGICLLLDDKFLFSGDTLFKRSIGRTDFPYGNSGLIIESLRNKIMPLDDAVKVFPGHGPSTTIGYEKQHNIFLKRSM